MIVPSVPAAPKMPCAVELMPAGEARATSRNSAGDASANAVPSTMPSAAMNQISGTAGYSRPQIPTPAMPTTSAKKPPSRSM